MLNYQRLIICCVFFAAVWVQSLNAVESHDIEGKSMLIYDCLWCVVRSKANLILNRVLGPDDWTATDDFIDAGRWMKLPDDERALLLDKFTKAVGYDYRNLKPVGNLARKAYDLLEETINEKMAEIKELMEDDEKFLRNFKEYVEDKGKYLDYRFFFEMQREAELQIRRLMMDEQHSKILGMYVSKERRRIIREKGQASSSSASQ